MFCVLYDKNKKKYIIKQSKVLTLEERQQVIVVRDYYKEAKRAMRNLSRNLPQN